MVEVLLIAVSLAMDAFAVSVSSGVSVRGFGPAQAVKMGLWFGFFQFAMPLLGWALGSGVSGYIEAVDHWLAFGLLAFIGARMVWEAVSSPCGAEVPADLTPRRLAGLALATSIDALAVGVTLAFVDADILFACAVIGAVAFVLSVLGGLLGRRLGCLFRRRAEVLGGLVLVGIGAKILMEHLYFGG